MAKFEKVSRFAGVDLPLPTRATKFSAGYDFIIAEDVVIPPIDFAQTKLRDHIFEQNIAKDYYGFLNPLTLDKMADITKELKAKPTLVSTGMKCKLGPDEYLEISVRSSTSLKHWLICANGEGIIDADYYDNESNEGEIFFQLINLSPFAIELKRGDKIGQGIIKKYITTEDDVAEGERSGGLGSTSEQPSRGKRTEINPIDSFMAWAKDDVNE